MNSKNEQRESAAQTKKHWVRLTRVCNNNCIFCLDSKCQNGTCLSFMEIKADLQQGRSLKIDRLVLSGGEPTLHPKFLDIVATAKGLGYEHIQVITNGRMFAYRDFLNQAVNRGVLEITFSMHGHTPQLHDRQTQVLGSFKQSLAGLCTALKIRGVIISVDIVINRINVKHLKDILNFFIKLGVSEFDLLQVIPFGRAWDNKDKVFYDIDVNHAYLKRAFQLSRKPNLYIWTNRFPPAHLEEFEDLIQHPISLYGEVKGRKDLFDALLRNKQKMYCLGKRCQYCFLDGFCKDLIKFTSAKQIASKRYPACITQKQLRAKETKILKLSEVADIFQFLKFYIQERYFIKSNMCVRCKFNRICDGVSINYIRKNGFRSLKPIHQEKNDKSKKP